MDTRTWWADDRGEGGGAALTWVLLDPLVLLSLGGIWIVITIYALGLALSTAHHWVLPGMDMTVSQRASGPLERQP